MKYHSIEYWYPLYLSARPTYNTPAADSILQTEVESCAVALKQNRKFLVRAL